MGELKQALRRQCRQQRQALTAAERCAWDAAITARVMALPVTEQADAVLCFVGTAEEIDTRPLLDALWRAGKQVYAPRCLDQEGHLGFFQIACMDDLEKGIFGLSEPKWTCKRYEGVKNPLCILPGLAFSLSGGRLGYGKGYYDRFLSKNRANTVGICYHCFIMENLPQDDYDRAVEWIITERACCQTAAGAKQNGGNHGE